MIKEGYFISFEGAEGVGKSTQIKRAYAALRERHGDAVLLTREPGGTALGEAIRELLLGKDCAAMGAMAELLLIFAARVQHLEERIRPALAAGKIVLCDRFTDASYAYQGAARGLGRAAVAALEQLTLDGAQPQLTALLDMPVERAMQRAHTRRLALAGNGAGQDRFEAEQQAFFQQVRQAYLRLAEQQPARVCIIDADNDIETVGAAIKALLRERGLLA